MKVKVIFFHLVSPDWNPQNFLKIAMKAFPSKKPSLKAENLILFTKKWLTDSYATINGKVNKH